jgi:hypothetical protein
MYVLPLTALAFLGPPIEDIIKATMQPAFALRVVAPAIDVLVQYVSEVPAEPLDFLLDTKPGVLHEFVVAALPEFSMPLYRPGYPVAHGFNHVFVHHLTMGRRQFPMPINDLAGSFSG